MIKITWVISTVCLFVALSTWGQQSQASSRHGTPTKAASTAELFQQLSPSVLVVESSGIKGKIQGSAVALGTNVAVTNCHVVTPTYRDSEIAAAIVEVADQASNDVLSDSSNRDAIDTFNAANVLSQRLFGKRTVNLKLELESSYFKPSITLRQGEKRWDVFTLVRPAFDETDADLCLLFIVGQEYQPLHPITRTRSADTLQIGEHVFTIGAPKGLELSLSEGVVSRLETAPISEREFAGVKMPRMVTRIQTTAPISPGSSGGALFDQQGALIGITTSSVRGGQNLNFALPMGDAAALLNSSRPQ
jgi:S1-C subfamily serine protease